MLEEIKRKIINNNDCDLSIEELKILYEIDTTLYSDISEYREKRNNYEDFCKMFGSLHVAHSPQEINIDTIAYIGNLYVEEELPTYNLRYIYGNLYYDLDKIYNLENLELIFGNGLFVNLKNSKGLENLSIIYKAAYFKYLENAEGLSSLKITGLANFENLKSEITPSANSTNAECDMSPLLL